MSSFPVGHNLVSEIKSFWKESLQINLWLEFFWDLCWPEQLGALPKEQQQGTVLLWFSHPRANCQLNCRALSPLGYSSPAVAYTRTMNPIRPLFVQGFTTILFISLPIKSFWRLWYELYTNIRLIWHENKSYTVEVLGVTRIESFEHDSSICNAKMLMVQI